jgi:hypothetical protein
VIQWSYTMLNLSFINKPEQRGSLLKKTSNLLFADLFKHRIRGILYGRNKDLKSIPVPSKIGLPYTVPVVGFGSEFPFLQR